jgi:hypothetical protein
MGGKPSHCLILLSISCGDYKPIFKYVNIIFKIFNINLDFRLSSSLKPSPQPAGTGPRQRPTGLPLPASRRR